MTDGYGVIWLCGDLRGHCHAVLPHEPRLLHLKPGSQVNWASPHGEPGGDAALIADLVSQAQILDDLFG
ncbi:hypothetical protein ACZ90_28435 [Streptomyces albus subsp. albus]|nr:hypothetical protein ACZ90_28435 [Streptomyces albus subsp. albus]